eukprot:UN32420
MCDQARLFGDENRRKELYEAGYHPSPHKAFDHKAPKTGKRRLKNFDSKLWEIYRERLMRRGTWKKFTQNDSLKKRIIQVGEREVVEATEDPLWGNRYMFGPTRT